MLAHLVIGSNDVEASKRFYDPVLATLGISDGDFNPDRQRLYYRTPELTLIVTKPLNGSPATVGNGSTIGFSCKSTDQARLFHDTAIANGGQSIEDPPGWREPAPGRKIYLAYVSDPSGHKLCAICHNADDD